MRKVRVQREDFDPGAAISALETLGGGGVASFIGIVRADGDLIALTLEQYPAMTARALDAIVTEACRRWPLLGATVIHRYGTLGVGERIVLVATAAQTRGAALESCAFLIDWLKTRAPFWKQERFAGGAARWVEAREADEEKAARWD